MCSTKLTTAGEHQITRRNLIRGTGIAAAIPLAAAHGYPSTAVARQSAADPETLVIADDLVGKWKTLDPAFFYEGNPSAAMYLIYDQLYHIPDGTNPKDVKPLLATALPTYSADGLEATVPLRTGVKFQHTGNEMTAADVIFSFNRLKNTGYFGSFLATDYWTGMEALDDYTVKFSLTTPNAELPALLSALMLSVTDAEAVKAAGGTDADPSTDAEDAPEIVANTAAKEIIDQTSAGSGPFMVAQWDLNSEVHLERFDDHWGTASSLKRVIWRNVLNISGEMQSVQAGEADIATTAAAEDISNAAETDDLVVLEGNSLNIQYMAYNLNPERAGILANQDVRHSIGHAIDHQGIIDNLLLGRGLRPTTVVPIPLEGTEKVLPDAFPHDLAKAQELWDGSGVGESSVDLMYASDATGRGGVNLATLAVKIQSDLQEINGLTVNLVPVPSAERSANHRAGDYQATISSWLPDYPGVDSFATPFFRTDASAARRSAYSDPEMDALLDQGIAEYDPEKRDDIYATIQRKGLNEAPYVCLYQPDDVKIANTFVQGATVHPAYSIELRHASKTG